MPHLRRSRASAVVFVFIVFLGRGIGGGSAGITTTHHRQGQAAHGAGSTCRDDDKEVGKHATAGAGNGGKSKGSARADNNQPKSDMKYVQKNTWSK